MSPSPQILSIAVASDLHCHSESPTKPKDSFLLAGARRIPAGKHPIQSLVETIRLNSISADIIVCPGDLANKVCQSGMTQAWEHLKELGRELKCRHLLTTIGNHDVDSRKEYGSDPFDIPKNLHPDFPTSILKDRDAFGARGFYFQYDEAKSTDFLMLNTVIGHTDEATARRGTFNSSHLSSLKDALDQRKKELYDISSTTYRIAVLHHHPLLHSSIDYGSTDVLEYGDQILTLLAQFHFKFIIHGHRHDPRISRIASSGIDQIVFAAGAFSAYLKELSSVTRNLFHLIEFNLSLPFSGTIRTWEFNYGSGWRAATSQSATLPYHAGFSIPPQNWDFIQSLCTQCDNAQGTQLRDDQIKELFPQFSNLLPGELNQARELLLSKGYKLVINQFGTVERCGKIAPT